MSLTGYSRSDEVALTHAYNGMDDRVSTTTLTAGSATSETRQFVYAPDGRVLGEYGANASDVRAEFIWASPEVGASGQFGGDDGLSGYMPLAVSTPDPISGTTQLLWVHANHMGVPALYTDASGAQITPPMGYSAPGFPGQSRTLADLYYNRYRDYDPTTGRYIQADPIGLAGGASPYSYAMNSPLRYTDPTGEFGVVGAAVGGGVDLFVQMVIEGKSWRCVDKKQLLISAAAGAIGAPAWVKFAGRGLKQGQGMFRANSAFPRGVEWVERSKFWPKRWGGTYSKYNVNHVWATEHALMDPMRYNFLPQWWKKANDPLGLPSRFWHRLPNWFKGATIPSAFASATQSLASPEECACK